MSAYEPKHLNPGSKVGDSLEERLRDAGRKFLSGTMSLILAASLVPATPQYAYAGEGDDPAEHAGENKGTAGNTASQPKEGASVNTTNGAESGNANDVGGPEEKGTDTPGDNLSNDGLQEDDKGQQGADTDTTTDNGRAEGNKTVEKNETTDTSSDKDKTDDSDKDKETESQTRTAQKTGASVSANNTDRLTLNNQDEGDTTTPLVTQVEVKVASGERMSSEYEGKTYYSKNALEAVFTIADETELQDVGVSDIAVSYASRSLTIKSYTLEADKKSAKLVLQLDADGTYDSSTAFTINGVTDVAGNALDATGAKLVRGTSYTVVAEAPKVTAAALQSEGETEGSYTIKRDLLAGGQPTYVNATAFAVDIDNSKGLLSTNDVEIRFLNKSGTVTKTVSLETETDTSLLETTDGDGLFKVQVKKDVPEGTCAIEITIKDVLGNERVARYGEHLKSGSTTDYEPDGTLTVDRTAPSLQSATISSTEVSSDSATAYGADGIVVTLATDDSSLDQDESYLEVKDGTGNTVTNTQGVALHTSWKDAHSPSTSSATFPAIDKSGTYTILIHLVDQAGNEAGDTQYTNVKIEATAPYILSLSSDGVHTSTNNQTLYTSFAQEVEGSGDRVSVTVAVKEDRWPSSDDGISLSIDGAPVSDAPHWSTDSTDDTVHTAKVEFDAEGTHAIQLMGADADGNAASEGTWTVVIDDAEPQARIAVTGKHTTTQTDESVIVSSDSQHPAQATVTITESNFMPVQDDNGGTAVEVTGTKSDGSAIGDGDYTLGDWDTTGSEPTRTVTFNSEGSYTITVTPGKDAVGNENATPVSQAIEVDNTAPLISEGGITVLGKTVQTADDSTSQTTIVSSDDDHPAQATVTIEDAHFLPWSSDPSDNGGTKVTVGGTKADGTNVEASTTGVADIFDVAWTTDGSNSNKHICTITFKAEGDYTVTAVAGKDAVANEDPSTEVVTHTVILDNTPPAIVEDSSGAWYEVVGKVLEEGSHTYSTASGEDNVIFTAQVQERNPSIDDGTTISVVNADGELLTEGTDYSVVWDEANDTYLHPVKVLFLKDGTYQVTIKPGTDKLGNTAGDDANKTSELITVDNVGPLVHDLVINGKKGKSVKSDADIYCYSPARGQKDVTVSVKVDEPLFLASDGTNDGTKIEVFEADGTTIAPEDSYTLGAWSITSSGATMEVTIRANGDYCVKVTPGKDQLGNDKDANGQAQSPKTAIFSVDTKAPTIDLTLPQDESYKQDHPCDGKEGSYSYYNTDTPATVVITEDYLDETDTLINGVPLKNIRKALVSSSPYEDTIHNVTYTSVSDGTDSAGKKTVTIVMTYGEGVHDAPLVIASDLATYTASSTRQLVVDKTAPSIVAAYVDKAPVSSESGQGQIDSGHSTYFFRVDNESDKTTVYLQAYEANGVKSLTVDGVSQEVGEPISGVYTVPITFLTADGSSYEGTKEVQITDYADHTTSWKMSDDGSIVRYTDSDSPSNIGHPDILLADGAAPELELHDDASGTERITNEAVTVKLDIVERYFSYLQALPNKPSMITITSSANGQSRTVTVDEAEGSDPNFSYSTVISPDTTDHTTDGDYDVTASVTDIVGHTASANLSRFTIDTIAPEISIDFDDSNIAQARMANSLTYYQAQDTSAPTRVATITVKERNFTLADLEEYMDISSAISGRKSSVEAPVATAWEQVPDKTDEFRCTVSYVDDGMFTLAVSGKDKAGNISATRSTTFVVDNTPPVVTNDYETIEGYKTLDGDARRFYSAPIKVTTTIRDRNLDTTATRLYDQTGKEISFRSAGWTVEGPDEDGVYTYTQTSSVDGPDNDRLTPRVTTSDFAANPGSNEAHPLVVDTVAPNISVTVDRTPTSTGAGNREGDPIQFFNQATTMRFSFSDTHLIRRVALVDPDNEYTISSQNSNVKEGAPNGVIEVALRDGTQSHNDTEYERPIYFMVEDIAGWQRTWTIDRQGNIIKDSATTPADNVSINGENIYPIALIQDVTRPNIELTGVTSGAYYNAPQTMRATINELNFNYLQQYAGSRPILFVTKYAGNSGRAMSSWEVNASQFSGSRPQYTYDQVFADDGHYVVRASFKDYANNDSNVVEIAEFTVDRTAPTITVTWDNNDARNGNYYRAGRTATITIVEHNFNPSDFTVAAPNANIGGWTNNGDTHTCVVSFTADGTHSLNVTGKDMAGNQMTPYTEPDFVIDTTMPSVSFRGTVQRYGVTVNSELENAYDGDISADGMAPQGRSGDTVGTSEEVLQDHHAYNGEVSPVIVFRDDNAPDGTNNYDGLSVDYTVTDGGGNDVKPLFMQTEQRSEITGEGNGQEYSFGNLGLVTDADGRAVVDENSSTESETHYVYDPDMDNVYTIHATITDLAGNQAENDITFSVNRYGSTYYVTVFDSESDEELTTEQGIDGLNYQILANAPRITVHEVNVSGSESDDDHQVRKEYANVASDIKRVASERADEDGAGYSLEALSDSDAVENHGWSEYVYTIGSGNFGMGSDSDNEDRGQGDYRVNVYSIDRATNDVGTDNYMAADGSNESENEVTDSSQSSAAEKINASRRNAQVSFRLDEIAPAIEDINLPTLLAVGGSYEASFYVNDVITAGDTVKIIVDGQELSPAEPNEEPKAGEYVAPDTPDGTGEYRFSIGSSFIPFSLHDVKISVTDARDGYEGHGIQTHESGKFLVTVLVPEIVSIAAVVGVIAATVMLVKRRRAVAEPDMPGSYE